MDARKEMIYNIVKGELRIFFKMVTALQPSRDGSENPGVRCEPPRAVSAERGIVTDSGTGFVRSENLVAPDLRNHFTDDKF